MSNYKSLRITGWVIVDEAGKIVNRNPNKDELKSFDKEPHKDGRSKLRCNYTAGDICYRCAEENNVTKSSILLPCMVGIEKDKDGRVTGRVICNNHYNRDYQKYSPNSRNNAIKLLANCRTGNQDSNHECTKADKSQELACKLYGWTDLNKENDNYRSPVDCHDPKTGLYYQVQMRHYNSIKKYWSFNDFEREYWKIFEDAVFFCFDKYWKMVERIYKFPEKIIKNRNGIWILKYDSKGNIYNSGWYEEYRVTNKDELNNANDIWKDINSGKRQQELK